MTPQVAWIASGGRVDWFQMLPTTVDLILPYRQGSYRCSFSSLVPVLSPKFFLGFQAKIFLGVGVNLERWDQLVQIAGSKVFSISSRLSNNKQTFPSESLDVSKVLTFDVLQRLDQRNSSPLQRSRVSFTIFMPFPELWGRYPSFSIVKLDETRRKRGNANAKNFFAWRNDLHLRLSLNFDMWISSETSFVNTR